MFFHKNILNVAIKSHKSKQTMEKMDMCFLMITTQVPSNKLNPW